MNRTVRLAIPCLAALLASCARSTSSGDLERLVHGYCFDLEEDLAQAAEHHHQLAAAIDEKRLSQDQLQRANDDLAASSVGNTVETRRARLRDFESRFGFCKSVHQMNDAISRQITVRLQSLHEQLSENVMTGVMPTAGATAGLLDQFHALVHEVNAMRLEQ